ncbi:MAG: RidA family protein [Clostridiales bacterium]|nr:RidA family protein [Clostridiales bacterium]
MKEPVVSAQAPAAIGPYSQGVRAAGLVFVSGQLPIDPATGNFPQGISEQTKQSIENCRAILESAGLSLANVVKTTVFLKDMNNFAAMNEVYASYFAQPFPARAAVEVARLPRDAMVEIEMIAAE